MLVKLRLELTWSAIDCLARSGKRIRIAETTAVWLYFTFESQGFWSLDFRPMNSNIDAWYRVR